MTQSPIGVAIFGASGYGGQELLRLLVAHPGFRVKAATSGRLKGRAVSEAHPGLGGFHDGLRFTAPEDPLPAGCAAVFLAVPYGAAKGIVERLRSQTPEVRIVDLSNDFRLKGDHDFVYGVPETNRKAIRAARHIANPGCFATGALLALAPLADRGLLGGDITLTQVTGSSGSGAEAREGTHHPERVQDMRAYKVLTHQHQPEIVQELRRLGASDFDVGMVPQSGPFSRGIFTVAHVRLPREIDAGALYAEHYASEFFVRLRTGTPALRHVTRTNFCDLAVQQQGSRLVVLSALDNLGKGMAGQAIQNMNLLFGIEETTGLRAPGANP